MSRLFEQIAAYLNYPEYQVQMDRDGLGEEYLVVSAVLKVGGDIFPCDIFIDMFTSQEGTEYIRFSTFIMPGVDGKNYELLHKVTDVITNETRGKLTFDHTDGSRDLLYSTYERTKAIDRKVVLENVRHLISIKGLLHRPLQELSEKLRLKLNTGGRLSKIDTQAAEWANNLLSAGVEIIEVKPEEEGLRD